MIKIKLPNKEIGLTWRHVISNGGWTECLIQDLNTDDAPVPTYPVGMAFLHPKDKYVKEIGRKLSLRDALKNNNFTLEERRMIWGQYFSRGQE